MTFFICILERLCSGHWVENKLKQRNPDSYEVVTVLMRDNGDPDKGRIVQMERKGQIQEALLGDGCSRCEHIQSELRCAEIRGFFIIEFNFVLVLVFKKSSKYFDSHSSEGVESGSPPLNVTKFSDSLKLIECGRSGGHINSKATQ